MPLVHLNGVPIQNVSMEEALALIDGAIEEGARRSVFFVNADCINITTRDAEYREILGGEQAWVFGDGVGIRWAGRLSRQPVRDNVNGTDMFPLLCARAAEARYRPFLLGARPGVAEEVVARMSARHPGLQFAGVQHGFFAEEETDAVIQRINEARPEVLLVAMGAPRQERWIAAHRAVLEVPVVMGVGGLFDFFSGRIPRAPRLLRDMSLEWSWRLLMEPRRMWKRYLIGNFTFMGRVLWWELSGRRE